jgi:MinD-like ATPase involved in chromosome partitioning or flagellar assembly
VTSSWGGRRYLPYAFTEQGVAMLSSILKSQRAIEVIIQIMRAFVRFKEFLLVHKNLAQKLEKVASRVEKHDEEIKGIFDAIRQLMQVPEKPRQMIGFHP